ncbi:MAG: hypothetical protein DRP00_01445 [Candidatus Aenigmatarchaeota archaeon]|nr:MAG: hypothetical protein DRP00_01445 [Candidatus Aenigmarchaeota archaeon]
MRVTVDLDENSKRLARWVFFNFIGIFSLPNFSYLKNFVPKIWKTRRGWHFSLNHLRISFEEACMYRLLLNDDRKRVRFDFESVHKPKQILFSKKDGYKKKEVSPEELI